MYANFQGDTLGHNSQHGGQSMEDVRARYWTRAGHGMSGSSRDVEDGRAIRGPAGEWSAQRSRFVFIIPFTIN